LLICGCERGNETGNKKETLKKLISMRRQGNVSSKKSKRNSKTKGNLLAHWCEEAMKQESKLKESKKKQNH
jgi:hypothetical protein